ncbi:hypothetical protein JOD27_000349 [Lentzea nigeriaca]|nr:hypothetical protein [Lentzea nigeriaca]
MEPKRSTFDFGQVNLPAPGVLWPWWLAATRAPEREAVSSA